MVALWYLQQLLLTGLAAGSVDSIAGGGGLITVVLTLTVNLLYQAYAKPQ